MTARIWIRSCLVLGVAGVVLAGYRAYDLSASRERLLRGAHEAAVQEAASAAEEIDENLRQASSVIDALASDLTEGRLGGRDLGARLEAILEADSELLSIGVAYAPDRLGRDARVARGSPSASVRGPGGDTSSMCSCSRGGHPPPRRFHTRVPTRTSTPSLSTVGTKTTTKLLGSR